jgi:hypothetical protein
LCCVWLARCHNQIRLEKTYVGCSVETWARSTDIIGARRSVGVSRVTICWDLDTTLLTTRNTIFGSRVCVRSDVWGSTLVIRVERAVRLALDYR